MGMFNRFKKIFKKEDEQPRDVIEEDIIDEPLKNSTGNVCEYCGFGIFKEQKIKTFNGKKYHLKPCFRNLIKKSKQISRGN